VRSRENGFYAILLVLLTFLIAASIVLGDLVSASASRTERESDTVAVLMQAKQALIARAALDNDRPGSLPCPARDTLGAQPGPPYGAGDPCNPGTGAATAGAFRNFLVGRLPWRTLMLPELRDKDNEPLWYAISDEFRDVDANRINSNTLGSLTVAGSAPANRIVAIIFAPGAPLPWQNRDPTSPAALNNVANYLEGENDYTLDPAGENDFEFEARPRSQTFNDILVVITQQELMDAVENAVAARIEKEIKPWLTRYYTDWGNHYPFAAAFDPTVSGLGQPTLTEGQFPVVPGTGVTQAGFSAPSSPVKVAGIGNLFVASSCTVQSGGAVLQCQFDHDDALTADVSVTIARAGVGFFPQPHLGADAPYSPGTTVSGDPAFGGASVVVPPQLLASGDATVTFRVNLVLPPALPPSTFVTITLPPPAKLMTEQNTSPNGPDWFFRNRWDRVTYYAIDSCTVPGAAPCAPTLTLKETGKADVQTRALLMLAGRPVSPAQAANRSPAPLPTPPLTDYFEQENAAVPTKVNFRKSLRATDFNDKVVLVGP
jgi:hypothetical protein